MAEFQKVAKARKRMCDSYETCSNGCPVGKMLNGIICSSWMLENPVLAETAIMKWDAELEPYQGGVCKWLKKS